MQKYRHVDSVCFESPSLLQPIINYATGNNQQRVAWLYGNYEKLPYKPAVKESKSQAAAHAQGFPLGIRTVVKAVYVAMNPFTHILLFFYSFFKLNCSSRFEPMQISSKVHIEFCRDASATELTELADDIARAAGLQRVGWIFSDLERDASKPRRWLEKRHAGTYSLKSNEVVLAAHLQSLHRNRCDFAESGYAGSKFCTLVLSGNSLEQDNIEPTAYQVSVLLAALLSFLARAHALPFTLLCPCKITESCCGLGILRLTRDLQVSDDSMHLMKQNIFVHSGHSNYLKVVQGDPGAYPICADFFLHLFAFLYLKFFYLFAEVDLTFEWAAEKKDSDPLAGAGGPVDFINSSKTKCVYYFPVQFH